MSKTYAVQPQLAKMLKRAVESDIPEITKTWADDLDVGRADEEAIRTFVALGWLSSTSDPRIKVLTESEEPNAKQAVASKGGVATKVVHTGSQEA